MFQLLKEEGIPIPTKDGQPLYAEGTPGSALKEVETNVDTAIELIDVSVVNWGGIEKFLHEIETGKFSVDEAFALKALAHLIGDVHQPLHCGNGTDMGGNKVKVKFFWESSNLHRVWDSGMIDYWSMSYTEYSVWVMSTRVASDIESWKNSSVKAWVKESVILREQCYAFDDPEKLGYRYIYDHSDLLHLRLAQGGVRLADALNKAYAKKG